MKRDVLSFFSYIGVAGQVLGAILLVLAVLWLVGVRGPLDTVRRWLWGYELWAAFVVAVVATTGSLFYSQIELFQPCELCWYQRLMMYPLSITLLLLAAFGANRVARYLLPLAVVGGGVSTYHVLIEYGAIKEPTACSASALGGCSFNWLAVPSQDVTFGYLAIPTLALTAFALLIGFLVLASTGATDDVATLPADA
ncbi:MAG TPA: disulfide bond formation protein B [Gaiellaceae bacterium]|jgi:disulfide bond formation protein DsbB